ncbi:MAG: aminomethyl-transferring glycine dehydrogenase [Acidimicrobiales bacterium]
MAPSSLQQLEAHDAFVSRHIGPSAAEVQHMLGALGLSSIDELIDHAIPGSIRQQEPLALPAALSEVEALAAIRAKADRNTVLTSLIGCGYHDTITPGVILRNILESPAWYTAYTPYQPEISQGRLEALLNFQTMCADLSGMDIANASLLDEATAAGEAMAMLHRVHKKPPNVFLVDPRCHPQTIAVVRVRAEPLGIDVVVADPSSEPLEGVYGVLVQYPGTDGTVAPLEPIVQRAHEAGALVAVAADVLALVLLQSPGAAGADCVIGSTQRFGVPMGFGGPHAAFMATRDSFKRSLPGRLVGVSVDTKGRTAYRLALQTREQHIRREKATSNICTAQVLLSVIASMYAVYHGPEGLRRIAERVHRLASIMVAGLRAGGVDVSTTSYFDTVWLRVADADAVGAAARERGLNFRIVDATTVGITLDETTTRATIEAVWSALGVSASVTDLDSEAVLGLPAALRRTDEILTHDVFHRYHSEHEMLRYLRRLADKDLALDRTMIPLGSCTMKLNATSEMIPITWPEFGAIHPHVPSEQVQGYLEMIHELEAMLVEITGYDAVSLQPNAGSQGEFAGLLAIRAYHRSRGDAHRNVCLIPSSAHGTNAASAAMAGMRVVVVECDNEGNVDVDDLKRRAVEFSEALSALMVTYPSTHGVFEERIGEICAVVHEYGGQVYLDGANLNALVGTARPGKFGADVSHLNLHKTFCIPHGGGGPGVGPVAVKAHLAPFLPGSAAVPAIAAAPFGSASILPISWMYVTMMGGRGLTDATHHAILNANYIAKRLAPHYPVLYTGEHGLVAHECILDVRPITQATGVSVEDIAKRLVDYGFHAPTMAFPVAGTLMIEPTESEALAELDRFCDAMIAVRAEITAVGAGEWPRDDNPLHNAPHTADDVCADDWTHPYSRELAAYPLASLRHSKYFAPVSRIDGAYGDRNVVCSCPPLDAYR